MSVMGKTIQQISGMPGMETIDNQVEQREKLGLGSQVSAVRPTVSAALVETGRPKTLQFILFYFILF